MINCCVRTDEQSFFDIYHENRFMNNKQGKIYNARMIICWIIKLIWLSTVSGTRFIILEQELLTLPEHPVFSGGHIGFCVQLHVFMFLVPCNNVNYDFARKTMYSHLFCKGLFIFNLYLFTILVFNAFSISDYDHVV